MLPSVVARHVLSFGELTSPHCYYAKTAHLDDCRACSPTGRLDNAEKMGDLPCTIMQVTACNGGRNAV